MRGARGRSGTLLTFPQSCNFNLLGAALAPPRRYIPAAKCMFLGLNREIPAQLKAELETSTAASETCDVNEDLGVCPVPTFHSVPVTYPRTPPYINSNTQGHIDQSGISMENIGPGELDLVNANFSRSIYLDLSSALSSSRRHWLHKVIFNNPLYLPLV
jgi:hypothetical protein